MTLYKSFRGEEPGIDALLHVSQISRNHVEKPADVLKIGQEVTAKIVDFNIADKKISLSIRALIEPVVEEKPVEEVAAPQIEEDAPVDIEKFIAEEAAAEAEATEE